MNKKKFIVCLLAVIAICGGIVGAQRLNSKYLKQKTYNHIFSLPTIAERKVEFAKLTPAQKAEIWRNDLLVKMKVHGYEGTEKEKILRDLSAALYPDLFDTEKTGGNPQTGEFAETRAAKQFFEVMGRYANAFSPEEAKIFCGILGEPTDPADEKAAKDKGLVDGADSPSLLGCDCNYESYCTWCSNYCQNDRYCNKTDGCGCFWFSRCNGICP
jgi:hypothetical protein